MLFASSNVFNKLLIDLVHTIRKHGKFSFIFSAKT